tara:strand:- start:378 stop:638 length:261 start_codon:yes stop_codon:yes gene_type:complete
MSEPTWKWSIGEPPQRSARRIQKEEVKKIKEDKNEWTKQLSKREDFNQRLGERDALISNGDNPFRPGCDYFVDIVTQDKFLRPSQS